MVRLEDLTLEEKIGQMLLFGWQADDAEGPSPSGGYPGAHRETAATTVNARCRRLLNEWSVGGVILMGRNVESPEQVARLTNELQQMCDVPLFVSTDQEGGHVCRMKKPFTVMPGNMPLGATRDADLARRAAKAVGEELKAIGINLNFAPVLDVNNNPDNPIIGVRSYGEDPELVARLGVAQIQGYRESGTIPCAKHFPGHGDTTTDSHIGLARIPYGMDRLNALELLPFRAAVEAGIPFVMTTHIIFEALDPGRPATLSPAVINGLLRGDLGFQGVVITDCMEMKAIADNFGLGEAAVIAVEAGVDICAACHTPEKQAQIRQALLDAVSSGRLTMERIDASVRRILACKEAFGLERRRAVDLDNVEWIVGNLSHRQTEQEIARRSITVVKDAARRIPLPSGRTVIVGPPDTARALAAEISAARMAQQLETAGIGDIRAEALGDVEHIGIGPAFEEAEMDAVRRALPGAGAVVMLTKHREPWTVVPQNEERQAALVKELHDRGLPLVVVALRNPYDLRRFPFVETYVAALGYTQPSLAALAEVLLGIVEPQGKLPVTIPAESPAPPAPERHEDTSQWGF